MDIEERNDNVQELSEAEVDITIVKLKSAKIKKVETHKSTHCNIILKSKEKTKAMNLSGIRHRKNKRIAKEQVDIRDSIYDNVINTSLDNICYTIVEEILDKTYCNLFGTWNIEIIVICEY